MTAAVVGMGSALPGKLDQQGLWDDYFAHRYAGVRSAERVFLNAGVTTRQGVVDPRLEDVSDWGTGERMIRYAEEALPLARTAAEAALHDAGMSAADIGMVAVASCTGYTTPGLDIRLGPELGLPADVQRLVVGHMGCYAAIPGLGAVADYVRSRRRPALLVCVELTSLHLQPGEHGLDQVVAHALFADAAAAVVVAPGPAADGWSVRDVAARTDPGTASYMTWDVTDTGFKMGLSPRVPAVLAKHVRSMVDDLLAAHGMTVTDVDGWAVHPGGPRILDVVADKLELPAGALDESWAVLDEHGNCSSPTVLMVLERIRRRGARTALALAFGPGLTLYAALLTT